MFPTFICQPFLMFMAVAIMALNLLDVPVAGSPHSDCLSFNPVSITDHQHGISANARGCCVTGHCCPLLPNTAAIYIPPKSRSDHSNKEQLDHPLMLVRALYPPPRVSVA